MMSIDTRVFAGFTIYAALSCAIGNDLAADYIRSLHQIPTKESVFFFATAAPMGILPIPQTLFAPATLILAILIDAADDSPLCRIRYRTTLLLTAKRFCTIALLSFGSTFLYLMIEAFQLLEMPIGAASPETVTAIFGQGAYFANTEVLLAASALDAYSQVFFVLLLFIIARTICSSRMAAFAIAVIVSAETLVWTRTLIVLGTTSFLETGDFPAGLASVAIAILLAFIICDIIKPNVSERSFPMHMLKVDNVSKRIKKQTILKNVNLEFESGRCYELKGANGSGKTMLIKIIAGLVKPTQGLVSVDDKTLGRDVEFLPNTGVLIESPSFIEDRTGLRNLELLASIRGTASEHSLRAIMETVGLDPDLKTLYRKYSLGMKQRLGIAAAIMEDPEIILLDEPLNALDEKGVFMVKRVIEQCKKTNALVIVSNHSNDLLDDVIDASVIFENGTATMRVNSGERP